MNDKSTEITEAAKATNEDFIQWLSEKGSEKLIEGMFFDPRSISVHNHIINNSKKLKNHGDQLFFSSYCKISTDKKRINDLPLILWEAGWQSDGCIKSLQVDKKCGKDIAIVEFKGMQNNYLKHNDIAKLFQYLHYTGQKEGVKLLWICRGSMAKDIAWIYSMLQKSNETNETLCLNTFLATCGTWATTPHIKGPCMQCTTDLISNKGIEWIENKSPQKVATIRVNENRGTYKLINYGGQGEKDCFHEPSFRDKISTKKLRAEIVQSMAENLIIVIFDEESDTQHNHPSDIEMISLKQLYESSSGSSGPFVDFMKKYLDLKGYTDKRQNLRRCQC